MKILNEEKYSTTFVLILDKKETKTLVEIVGAAHESNKRRSSFRIWKKKLEDELCAF
jgi:hypothetical protein